MCGTALNLVQILEILEETEDALSDALQRTHISDVTDNAGPSYTEILDREIAELDSSGVSTYMLLLVESRSRVFLVQTIPSVGYPIEIVSERRRTRYVLVKLIVRGR